MYLDLSHICCEEADVQLYVPCSTTTVFILIHIKEELAGYIDVVRRGDERNILLVN
jgi:hypothetical protein